MISRACYHRRTAKVMLSSLLVCNLVCRLVCLSVSNITGKRMNRFSRKFQDMLGKIQGTIWTIFFFFFFFGGGVNPLHTGFIFYIFARKFVSVRYITEKTDFGGVRIWNKEQSEFFGMFRLTPWIRERFFHFRDPCFLVLLWENEWMDLHKFSIICQARPRLITLFHGLSSRHDGVSVSNITVKWNNRFSWNFHDRSVTTWGTIWDSLGWCV